MGRSTGQGRGWACGWVRLGGGGVSGEPLMVCVSKCASVWGVRLIIAFLAFHFIAPPISPVGSLGFDTTYSVSPFLCLVDHQDVFQIPSIR